ncbi:MAG TPA: hypothetical protein VFX85_07650 [Solirubrobacterales bacterium]|nr:hypothetical protein [Solirubrobacterales bacterium]
MGKGIRRQAPALLVACIALVAALGGTVVAAAKIDGKTIRVKSLPGNRVAPASLPGDRIKPGTIGGDRLAPGSVGGAQIDAASIAQVPSAAHADEATSADDARTALHAVSALDADRVNGHSAGCMPPSQLFAGACWGAVSAVAVPAPAAAGACATQGGELPGALALAAYSQQPGVTLAVGDEWTSDVTNVSGPNLYAVVTVAANATVSSEISTAARKYRCVIPLVS